MPHTLFLFFPPWYPPSITGEKQKYNQSRVFMLSRVLNYRLYQNHASAQLHLMHTLILVKPVASGFTLHQSSTHLEVTYFLQDILPRSLPVLCGSLFCKEKPGGSRLGIWTFDQFSKKSKNWFGLITTVLQKIRELVKSKSLTSNHQFSAGTFIKTC